VRAGPSRCLPRRLRHSGGQVLAPTAAQRWQRILAATGDEAGLAEGALVIAAREYPDLDIEGCLERINALAAELARRLHADMAVADRLAALNRYLFEELRFSGNAADYYDPCNSYLNDVLERRLGIPITLSILYIEVGRRLGLDLHGVSFPGHFLVRCRVADGVIVLDPYARGVSLSLDELQQRLQTAQPGVDIDPDMVHSALMPASASEILARLLRNLRAIFLRRKDPAQALAAAGDIVDLLPDAADEYVARARIYLALDCFRAALADYETCLRLQPEGGEAAVLRLQAAELRRRVALLN